MLGNKTSVDTDKISGRTYIFQVYELTAGKFCFSFQLTWD